jgi:hypothetical protein
MLLTVSCLRSDGRPFLRALPIRPAIPGSGLEMGVLERHLIRASSARIAGPHHHQRRPLWRWSCWGGGLSKLRPGPGSLPPQTVEPVEPQKCDRREPHAVIGRRQALRLWPAPGARHHLIEWAGALRGAAGSRAKDSPTTAGDPGPGFRVARKPWQTLTLPEGFRAVSPDQRIQENPGSDCLKPWIPPAICQRPLPRPPPGSCEG